MAANGRGGRGLGYLWAPPSRDAYVEQRFDALEQRIEELEARVGSFAAKFSRIIFSRGSGPNHEHIKGDSEGTYGLPFSKDFYSRRQCGALSDNPYDCFPKYDEDFASLVIQPRHGDHIIIFPIKYEEEILTWDDGDFSVEVEGGFLDQSCPIYDEEFNNMLAFDVDSLVEDDADNFSLFSALEGHCIGTDNVDGGKHMFGNRPSHSQVQEHDHVPVEGDFGASLVEVQYSFVTIESFGYNDLQHRALQKGEAWSFLKFMRNVGFGSLMIHILQELILKYQVPWNCLSWLLLWNNFKGWDPGGMLQIHVQISDVFNVVTCYLIIWRTRWRVLPPLVGMMQVGSAQLLYPAQNPTSGCQNT